MNRDGTLCLRAFHGNRDDLCIPETLMGIPVTSIGRCFSGPAHAQLVTIPSTVRSIGPHALQYEEDLRAVVIPPEVTSIADTAFDKLQENEGFCLYVTEGSCAHTFAEAHGFDYELNGWPEPMEDDPCLCGDWLYAVTGKGECVIREYNGSDRTVVVPAELDGYAVTGVNSYCFNGNLFMEELIVPDGVTYLGNYAVARCASLRRVQLPDSVTSLGGGCFAHCRDLEEISLPRELSTIMIMAFIGCVSLRRIALPDGVHTIFPMAFHGCRSLEEIRLSPALTSVMSSAFERCPRLRRPTLPDLLDAESRAALNRLPA